MDKIVLDNLSINRIERKNVDREFSKALNCIWSFSQGNPDFEMIEVRVSVTSVQSPLSYINVQDLENRGKKIRITIDEVDI